MGWKKKAGIGISITMLLLLIYQLGNAILDAAQMLFNINVPTAYYGVLSLLFIFVTVYMFLKNRLRG